MRHDFTWSPVVPVDPFAPYVQGIYRFNDYSDSSGKGNNLSSGSNNSLVSSPSMFYNSLSVPLSTGAVGVTMPSFDMTGNFTMEGWVYLTSYGVGTGSPAAKVTNTIFGVRQQSVSGIDLAINTNGTVIQATSGTGASGAVAFSGSTSIALNTWYHLAFVRSGTTGKIYVNGVQAATGTVGNYSARPITLGSLNFAATTPTNYRPLLGYLNDVRFTTAARYLANFTPPDAL